MMANCITHILHKSQFNRSIKTTLCMFKYHLPTTNSHDLDLVYIPNPNKMRTHKHGAGKFRDETKTTWRTFTGTGFKHKRSHYRPDYAQIIVGQPPVKLLRCRLRPKCPILDDLCANVAPRNPRPRDAATIIMRKQFLGCILMLQPD